MKIRIFDKEGKIAYVIPVGDNSIYSWKLQTEEYIQVNFSSDTVLKLKKGYYTEIGDDSDPTNTGALGRFEIVTLPTPTASSKVNGYDYELRMDRPWCKFKNRIFFMARGSVAGMEAKWSLTDTIASHTGILTDNLKRCGFNYRGNFYHVVIHEGVDTEKSKLISYDSTTILQALTSIAEAFETEWWIEKDAIHFGRCEQGDAEVELEMHTDISALSRSEDSSTHGTRLYAFGSSRNLNQNYRRHLRNPFTVNGWHTIYKTVVKFTVKKPTRAYSENKVIEFKTGYYAGQRVPFTVVSGLYAIYGNSERITDATVYKVEMPMLAETAGIAVGDTVQFIIGDATATQTDDSIATITSVTRDYFVGFSFKDLKLPQKAITSRTTLTLNDGTGEKRLEYVGVITSDGSSLNDGRDLYKFADDSAPKSQTEQSAILAHPSMMYVSKLYTEPVDGQADVAIQGITDNVLQLPMGTPYIDSESVDNEEEISEITEQNEDIYPRCLLTITEVTSIDAKETDEDTGNVTYWKAYRFKAKKTQDDTPFEFDESYLIQDEDKSLSVHFESGKLAGLEFEVRFNPEATKNEKRLFEITRNDNYTLELPNETACPVVGDTFYMFNMDADIIDEQLVSAAETELKAWAEREIKKLTRDSGTYTATTNPVEWGKKKLGNFT